MSSIPTPKKILDLDADKQANRLESDYLAEVIAAGLIEQGYESERIHILREGAARRGFAKDIEDMVLHFSQYDLLDYLHIKTNRGGLYDILPEGLFHQPIHKKNRIHKDKEDILDEIKIHREEEFFARKFFQLFEVEINHALTGAYLYEAKYDKKMNNTNFVDVFLPYWPVLKMLQPRQALLFMHVIPILHRVRNQQIEIEEALSMVMEAPVKIKQIKLPAKEASDFFESRLGECRLGVDWVLGKSFDDGRYDVKIAVGPISAKKMEFFLDTAPGNTILEILFRLFLPGDIFTIKEFIILPEDAEFILSDENRTTYLGINTFL